MDASNIQRILVGDDQIDFARENFPAIPNARASFSNSPVEVVARVREGGVSILVTDLNYTPGGLEGFWILQELSDVPIRKILWTGEESPEVRARAAELGAEVLGKDQIASLVGQVVSGAPFKEGGKILLYVPAAEVVAKAYTSVLEVFGLGAEVTVSSSFRDEVMSGEYGLVIDTSAMGPEKKGAHGSVAHDLKYMKLLEVPRVAVIKDICSSVAQIATLAHEHIRRRMEAEGMSGDAAPGTPPPGAVAPDTSSGEG